MTEQSKMEFPQQPLTAEDISKPVKKTVRRGRSKKQIETQLEGEVSVQQEPVLYERFNHKPLPCAKASNITEDSPYEGVEFSPDIIVQDDIENELQNRAEPKGESPSDSESHKKRPKQHSHKQNNAQRHYNEPHSRSGKHNKQSRNQDKQQPSSQRQQNQKQRPTKSRQQNQSNGRSYQTHYSDCNWFPLAYVSFYRDEAKLAEMLEHATSEAEPFRFESVYNLTIHELTEYCSEHQIVIEGAPTRRKLLTNVLRNAHQSKQPILITGIIDIVDNGAVLVYQHDNYRQQPLSAYIPRSMIRSCSIKRGQSVVIQAHPPRQNEPESCPFALKIVSIMGEEPSHNLGRIPFEELTPYYPLERIILESKPDVKWDNLSMRVVDLLIPVGLGQRGLIVAPPRTGKTVLMQAIAQSISLNRPDVHLIILLVDERPEEVTDFKRQLPSTEIISSTFDEPAESHVHAAEMVIAKSRRMVESGKHVVILLDSITRLARAYNTIMPSSGKILSGGVEASSLQMPKRFFGSARNIEGGGSLTILGSALIETGSRMDEVIFEEFKGTGNMELHLDRGLSDKRIYPALNFERSGTRKEELLYHEDEMNKVHSLRRALKGVPSLEAMEMLIQRIRKTRTNIEFLMGLNR